MPRVFARPGPTGCESFAVHALKAHRAPRREARERYDYRQSLGGRSTPRGNLFLWRIVLPCVTPGRVVPVYTRLQRVSMCCVCRGLHIHVSKQHIQTSTCLRSN